ncbi:MAG TPA: rod shape-determining protein RodA [Methylomirabilota bacterium]|nr:rod shape-determining protein RodA [Methylomirabilota bacterium]
MFDTPINERHARIDWILVVALLGLMAVGTAFIYSAASTQDGAGQLAWYQQFHVKQLVWYSIGLSFAVIIAVFDYHVLSRWAMIAYWVAILLLILVLIPGIGKVIFGARRWIDLGFFNLQPSEFAKLAFLAANAHFLSRPRDELRSPGNFWKSLGLAALPMALIIKEPDLGSALIFIPMSLGMLFIAGAPTRFLAKLVGVAAVFVSVMVIHTLFAPPQLQIIEEYQRKRLLVYFGADFAPRGASDEVRRQKQREQRQYSYNVEQAMISVGSGGLLGKGWCQGTQNALGYLPRAVAHNDFIFSVIAEEKGFIGSVFVVTLYSAILFSGIRIAGQARDRLGKLLAGGVVIMLFSHVFINIGMNIRIMPVTGVPLPLLSYGGSSVVCALIAVGILQNVHLHRRAY